MTNTEIDITQLAEEEYHEEDIFDFAYKENYVMLSELFEEKGTDPDSCDQSGFRWVLGRKYCYIFSTFTFVSY